MVGAISEGKDGNGCEQDKCRATRLVHSNPGDDSEFLVNVAAE